MWKSNVGRPTPSTRCYLREWICSMAWRFHAIDSDVFHRTASARWRGGSESLTESDVARSRVAAMPSRSHESITTQVLQDKDQQIDINRKKAVDVMRACFKPILPTKARNYYTGPELTAPVGI